MYYIYNYLLRKSLIEKKDKAVIIYGLKSCIFNIITIISTLTLSFIFKSFIFGLIFLLSYAPFRMIIGGYHCKTPLNCFLCYNILLILIFNLDITNISITHCYILLLFLLFIPSYITETKNHIDSKKQNAKKIKLIILLSLIMIPFKNFYQPIYLSLLLNFILVTIAYIHRLMQSLFIKILS